jgi:hypothetical protein
VFDPSNTQRAALARKQAHELIKRCDELIDCAERALSDFTPKRHGSRVSDAAGIGGDHERSSFAPLTERDSLDGPISNSNQRGSRRKRWIR